MLQTEPTPPLSRRSRTPWVLAVVILLLHVFTANRYGIFRDEMYGLACADHLAWGYVDHPPGGIVIAWVARHLFGASALGLRLLPALAGATLVWLTGRMARELGGGPLAQSVAALAVSIAPIYLIFDHWLMMNAFEPLIWLGCFYCVLRVIETGNGRYWLGFGLLCGIGCETKYSIVFLLAGVFTGLALSPQRRCLADRHFWAGLLICGTIALPNFLWQWRHGFPFLEFRHNVALANRDVVRGPLPFVLDQMAIMGPLSAPLWLAGVAWFLGGPRRRQHAVFGWAFLVVLGAFVVLKGKNYYVSPVYPIAFAGGAVAFERFTASGRRRSLRSVYPGLMVASSLVILPLSVPILPPDVLVRYARWLGMTPPQAEHQNTGPLPQYFADEFGWEEMVREVARVYHTLPPEERRIATIFSNNWGDAAAVDYFGPKYGLPRAVSKNNSYWLWGPGNHGADVMIILHTDGVGDRKYFGSVEKAGRVEHPYSRRDEWFDIYVCRQPKFDLRAYWPKLKSFD